MIPHPALFVTGLLMLTASVGAYVALRRSGLERVLLMLLSLILYMAAGYLLGTRW